MAKGPVRYAVGLVAASASMLAAPVEAQTPEPDGSEFQVNAFTTGNEAHPSIAADASGNFVVVWESYGEDGSNVGVFGRRFDSGGGPLGPSFRVNSYTTGIQAKPRIATDGSGFVVVWQ